jgi:hypothetical protein
LVDSYCPIVVFEGLFEIALIFTDYANVVESISLINSFLSILLVDSYCPVVVFEGLFEIALIFIDYANVFESISLVN